MAAKKKDEQLVVEESVAQEHNPLLAALKENDKKNLFKTNVTTAFHKTGFPMFDYYFGAVINVHDDKGMLVRQEPRIGQAAGTFNLIIGPTGAGKAQPLSTMIPTPDGEIRMGDIKPGQRVFNENGHPVNVTGVFPQGIKKIYKIELDDHRTTRCCGEHLWTITTNVGGRTTLSTKTINQMMKDGIECYIQDLTMPVHYDVGEVTNYEFIAHDMYDYGRRIANGLIKDPSTIKHTYSSTFDRLNILLGILSKSIYMEGYHCDGYNTYIITSTDDVTYDYDILKWIQTFASGLGFKSDFTADEVMIALPMDIDTSSPIWEYTFKDTYRTSQIISITEDGEEECQCIWVDSVEHLYLTNDFIVTHNTTLATQIAANIIRQYKYANVIHYDCENRIDVSRCENITHLPLSYFESDGGGERYMIKTGQVGLDVIQEMIVKTYVSKMRLKDKMIIDSGYKDEFGKPVMIFQPTVIIIDSMTSVMNETFSADNNKQSSDAEKLRGNTEGARDAKTLKGFFKDVIPLCKEANIIMFGINHINSNMSMNAFLPPAKQQFNLKQDESIPGGKTMLYYPFNIVKLTPKGSDNFSVDADGFQGYMVMVEPIKCSSNQSGNNSKGISFELVFASKRGFDSLRSLILYGRERGIIEGNRTRMKFKDDDSFTFSLKNIYKEKDEKPIWECIRKYIIPDLDSHLSYLEPDEFGFDARSLDY